jgi:glycosyltransferase involved in cell wall biosynthesis
VPRVTVLTTVYNGARYLEAAVESIRADGFADYEHVIVDDGSTDATPEILAREAANDPRIVIVRNETNRGIAPSANRGLGIARGELIARLDADDLSLAGRLARQVAYLDAYRDVVLVSMNYETITADGTSIGRSHRDHPDEVLAYLLRFSNALGGHSQVMFRASVVQSLGGYDETCQAALDYELWSRMTERGRIVVLPELGMRYRIHAESRTTTGRALQIAVGKRVLHRMLSAYLGRTLTPREVDAVAHAWRSLVPSIDAKLANAILHEAFAIFRRTADARARRIVRRVTAHRLVNTAVLLLARKDVRNGVRHWLQALRWDFRTAMRRTAQIAASRVPRVPRSSSGSSASAPRNSETPRNRGT